MALIQKDLRLRIERILNGSGQAVDLATLFLSQRAKPWVRPSVLEIGDFIAHRDERVRGDVFKQTKAAVMSARALCARESKSINWPEAVAAATTLSLKLQDETTMHEHMGFGLSNASSMLGRCKSKRFGELKKLNNKENRLIELLIEPPAKMVITSERLIEDLSNTLLQSKLISTNEAQSIISAKDIVSIFAVSQIHGTTIALEDGYESNLHAIYHDGGIGIWSEINLINKYFQPFRIMFAVCRLNLDSIECVCDELKNDELWLKPVELKQDQKLYYT